MEGVYLTKFIGTEVRLRYGQRAAYFTSHKTALYYSSARSSYSKD